MLRAVYVALLPSHSCAKNHRAIQAGGDLRTYLLQLATPTRPKAEWQVARAFVQLCYSRRCSPSETAFGVSKHCPPPILPQHRGKWANSPNRWQLTWKAYAYNLARRTKMARKGCVKHSFGSLPMLGYSDYFFSTMHSTNTKPCSVFPGGVLFNWRIR